ncbi:MAG: hypothetical protein ACKO96_04170 [Flammeovirgaceae bacterium]
MKMKIDRAFLFFFLTVILVTLLLEWGATLFGDFTSTVTRPVLMGMALVTTALFIFLRRIKNKVNRENQFALVTFYMLSIFLKFIIAGVVVFIILKYDTPNANANVIFFMVCYISFTVLEVAALVSIRSPQSQ